MNVKRIACRCLLAWTLVPAAALAQSCPRAAALDAKGVKIGDRVVREVERKTFADGEAVRYVLPAGTQRISGEDTVWTLPDDATVWFEPNADYEALHTHALVKDIPVGQRLSFPFTAKLADGTYRLCTEANVVDYTDACATYLGGGRFGVCYYAEPKGFDKEAAATTPWRVMLVAKDLQTLATSDIVRRLCPAPDPAVAAKCATFVRPGRCTWQWLPDGSPKFEEQKDWYDRTKAIGFEYYLIDDGWRVWRDGDRDQWACLKSAIDYGKSIGVATFVWVDSKEMRDAASRRAYLDKVVAAGAVGIKIDFVPPATLKTMAWYEETLADTLARRLMTDFHGCVKPSGRERTWPHEVAREAIRGHEYHITRYQRILPPEHDCILPFTRLVQGHADYTPVVFEPEQLIYFTWPRQLAQGIVFSAPFLCFGDFPKNYQESPMRELVQALPATYDETRYLEGSAIGECVVVAKRKGRDWFLAIENGAAKRNLSVSLDFLGGPAKMLAFSDDPSGRLGACVRHESLQKPSDRLALKVKSCGGFVARFTPAD